MVRFGYEALLHIYGLASETARAIGDGVFDALTVCVQRYKLGMIYS